MPSLTADELVRTAKECYSLGLIDERRLERVTSLAETQPGYDGCGDLPFYWEIEHERELRAATARHARKIERRRRLRRLFGIGGGSRG